MNCPQLKDFDDMFDFLNALSAWHTREIDACIEANNKRIAELINEISDPAGMRRKQC
jgi:hypothetical protein